MILPESWSEVVAANALRLFEVVASVPVVGKVSVVAPVAVNVVAKAPAVVNELPFARAKVAPPAVGVMARLLTDVARAAPNTGVIKFGELLNTESPVPVSSFNATASPAEFTSKFSFRAADVVTALFAKAVVAI